MTTTTGIEPIVQSVETKAPPQRAFEAFTGAMGDWWPRGMTIGARGHAAVVIEPRAGGRWYERDADGVETDWGRVLEWEPPGRLLLAWQINSQWAHDPAFETRVELRFEPRPDGGTRVTLEHRDLERYGADAERHAGQLRSGWPGLLQGFAALADGRAAA
jgi:uncharacterized protein YndB with AHSA1/START domain